MHYDEETGSSTEYRYDPVNPFDAEVMAYCETFENRKQIDPNVIDGFNVDNLLIAMFESSNMGKK